MDKDISKQDGAKEAGRSSLHEVLAVIEKIKNRLDSALYMLNRLELPSYPAGGTVGITEASALTKRLADALDENRKLDEKLKQHAAMTANAGAETTPTKTQ